MAVTIKRIYEPFAKTDGFRILVDRLWPRGISKEKAHIDLWLKEIAPSTELRNWFNHEPEKWKEFCTRYKMELKDSAALSELRPCFGFIGTSRYCTPLKMNSITRRLPCSVISSVYRGSAITRAVSLYCQPTKYNCLSNSATICTIVQTSVKKANYSQYL
jgi:uncharacterized protein YeaO (DUF488 family)